MSDITLTRTTRNYKLTHTEHRYNLSRVQRSYIVESRGPRGLPGPQGIQGEPGTGLIGAVTSNASFSLSSTTNVLLIQDGQTDVTIVTAARENYSTILIKCDFNGTATITNEVDGVANRTLNNYESLTMFCVDGTIYIQ